MELIIEFFNNIWAPISAVIFFDLFMQRGYNRIYASRITRKGVIFLITIIILLVSLAMVRFYCASHEESYWLPFIVDSAYIFSALLGLMYILARSSLIHLDWFESKGFSERYSAWNKPEDER